MIVIGMIWFPESPRHLMEKDKPDEAMKVVCELPTQHLVQEIDADRIAAAEAPLQWPQ